MLSIIYLSVCLAVYHIVLSKIKKSNLSSFFAFSCTCHIPCPAMGLIITLLVTETGNNCSIYLNKQKQWLWLKKLSCSSVVLSVAVSRSWPWSSKKVYFAFFCSFSYRRNNYLHLVKSTDFTVPQFKVGQALSSVSQDYFLFKLSRMLQTAQSILTYRLSQPRSEGCLNGCSAPSPWAPPG